ncbi:MAG: hypothetical protein U0075_16670 [Thermomicrobiales bacterium]
MSATGPGSGHGEGPANRAHVNLRLVRPALLVVALRQGQRHPLLASG